MKEDNIGNLGDIPNERYQKLFDKFKEIETLEIAKWNTNHILGYFCQKYQNHYKTKYQFKFNSPAPSKCFEIFQVKRLASMLSSNPTILKGYIDWVFDTKVKNAKRKLTSISFLTQEDTMNYYKINILLASTEKLEITRSTALPSNYINILSSIGNIKSYGDLSFIYKAYQSSTDASFNIKFQNALSQLKAEGFNEEILNKIV